MIIKRMSFEVAPDKTKQFFESMKGSNALNELLERADKHKGLNKMEEVEIHLRTVKHQCEDKLVKILRCNDVQLAITYTGHLKIIFNGNYICLKDDVTPSDVHYDGEYNQLIKDTDDIISTVNCYPHLFEDYINSWHRLMWHYNKDKYLKLDSEKV